MKNLLLLFLAFLLSSPITNGQAISTHQFRKVDQGDMQEYIKRETTYWKKFAENEVKNGNLSFWGIFQRIGITDQENSPNILIINTYRDIDKPVNWARVTDLFPNVKMEDIQTWSMSTNTDQIFLRNLGNHVEVDDPEFNIIRVIYHNKHNTNQHLTFQSEKWKPMIKKAMEEGTTTMQGWGNATILAPQSEDFQYDIYTYDLFSSLNAALSPGFTDEHEMPDDFWEGVPENNAGPRKADLYRIIAAVTDREN